MAEEQVDVDTSGTHLQTQKCMQNTSWEQAGVPEQRKRMYRTTQNSIGGRNQGGKQECQQDWTCPWQVGGTEAGVQSPHRGNWSESEEKHLRMRVKQLISGSLNGMRIRQSLPQPYIPQAGPQVPGKAQKLGAGFQGLQSNPRARAATDCREMMGGGDVRKETMVKKCLWRKARQPWKQGDTAESCIVSGAITIASLPPHTCIGS